MANNLKVWLYSSDPSVYQDVTSYVISLSSSRGKTRELDYYEPGTISISFNNQDRAFDPTNTSSPLYGYVKPKQRVYVSAFGFAVFSGLIDDWTLTYDVNGNSIASLAASEKTNLFSNQYLIGQTFPSELSGARVSRILNDDMVQWPTAWGSRVIDAGTQVLDADTIEDGTNVLEYLQKIQSSEQGQLFIDGTDSLKFQDNSRSVMGSATITTFADDNTTYISAGSAIPAWKYDYLDVSYSTTLLYNRIQINSWDGVSQGNAHDPSSIAAYQPFDYVLDDVLYSDKFRLGNLATYIGGKYSQPEYRFNSIRVNFYELNSYDQATLLNEVLLNGFARVRFKPNNTGNTIDRFVRIIGVQHEAAPGSHDVTYLLESIKIPALVLSDADFGKLDVNVLGL